MQSFEIKDTIQTKNAYSNEINGTSKKVNDNNVKFN